MGVYLPLPVRLPTPQTPFTILTTTRMVAQAGQGSGFFNLWLKDQGYSTAQINTIPTAGNAISVIASLFFGTIADRTGTRKETCAVVCVIVIVSNIMLSVWNIPRPALLFAFFLSFVSAAAQPLIIVTPSHRQSILHR